MGIALGISPASSAVAQTPPSSVAPQRLIDLFSPGLQGDPKQVRLFVEMIGAALDNGADIEAADEYGNTPLMTATYWAAVTDSDWGPNKVVAFLLARGADPNHGLFQMDSMTPMEMAANSAWPNVELVELLCAAGANVGNRMGNPERTFSGTDRPIAVTRFPQVQEAIQACARGSQSR